MADESHERLAQVELECFPPLQPPLKRTMRAAHSDHARQIVVTLVVLEQPAQRHGAASRPAVATARSARDRDALCLGSTNHASRSLCGGDRWRCWLGLAGSGRDCRGALQGFCTWTISAKRSLTRSARSVPRIYRRCRNAATFSSTSAWIRAISGKTSRNRSNRVAVSLR